MLAFALRHQPLRFGVALDEEGFADLDELVVGIRFSRYDWATLDREQVQEAIRGTDAGRSSSGTVRSATATATASCSARRGSDEARRSSSCTARRPEPWRRSWRPGFGR
ncbi:MAG: hypothetical protein K2P78_07970 [Gemmataceae bacterium]|nr:hypothetical protein [Gemmataceae bacterium]